MLLGGQDAKERHRVGGRGSGRGRGRGRVGVGGATVTVKGNVNVIVSGIFQALEHVNTPTTTCTRSVAESIAFPLGNTICKISFFFH